MKEVIVFLNNLLNKEDVLIVATSGGPDSMCLLHILKNNFKNKIICAHVNHGVRDEAIKEAEFLKNYCLEMGIIFEYQEIKEYQNNKFSESEGRRKRYEFFNQLLDKYQAKYIMTAHQAGDLEETILMRLIRGSNLKGYIGIKRVNHNYVRPLLTVTKDEILEYDRLNKIEFFTDYTNEDIRYTRNRIRKKIMPLFLEEDPNIHKKFLKFSEELIKYHDYVNKIIQDKVKDIYKNGKINIDKLKKEDNFISEKIIEYVIEDRQKDYILDINDKNKQDLMALINSDKNKQVDLGNGFIGRRSYNNLIIEKNSNIESYDYIFKNYLKILDRYVIERVNESHDISNEVIRINSKDITLPLHIRSINSSDIMKVKNMKGIKRVNDILKNAKIDVKLRRVYPLVSDSQDRIIWVPGVKKSIFDREINEKYDIILKYTEEKDE